MAHGSECLEAHASLVPQFLEIVNVMITAISIIKNQIDLTRVEW